MSDFGDHLKEMLKTLEKHKVKIMEEINNLRENEQTIMRTNVYPMADVKPLNVNGYKVFQFGYEGVLPSFKENDQEYLSMVRHYYYRATFGAYDFSKFNAPVMKKAFLVFVQFFKDYLIRDLDNRNKKYIQDAIRQTPIIGDDHWDNVWNTDLGFKDDENHVQVFVVERENFTDFIDYIMKNPYVFKGNFHRVERRSVIEEQYKKEVELEKKEVERKKKDKRNSADSDAINMW